MCADGSYAQLAHALTGVSLKNNTLCDTKKVETKNYLLHSFRIAQRRGVRSRRTFNRGRIGRGTGRKRVAVTVIVTDSQRAVVFVRRRRGRFEFLHRFQHVTRAYDRYGPDLLVAECRFGAVRSADVRLKKRVEFVKW